MSQLLKTIGDFGERVELRITRGDRFGPHEVTLVNPDNEGAPVNLTGCRVVAYIKKRAADESATAIFDCSITSAAAGTFTFGLSMADTVIDCGPEPEDEASQYVWDMKLIDSNGDRLPIYYGPVLILVNTTPIELPDPPPPPPAPPPPTPSPPPGGGSQS